MTERFYRCWAGTEHAATNIPEGASDDVPLEFLCDCMGTVWDNPAVKREVERGAQLTAQDALILAELHRPPRRPVVRVGDLETRVS